MINNTPIKSESSSFLGAFGKLRKMTTNFVMSVRKKLLGSHWTDFHEILYENFENLSRKFKIYQNPEIIMGTLHDDLCTCMMVSRRIFSEGEILRTNLYSKSKQTYHV
jgi:hypothetical protein